MMGRLEDERGVNKRKVRRKYTSEKKYSFLLRGSDYPKWKTLHMMDTDDRNCIADGLARHCRLGIFLFLMIGRLEDERGVDERKGTQKVYVRKEIFISPQGVRLPKVESLK